MSSPVVQIATIKIRPGEEKEFTTWQIRYDAALEKFPGFISSDAVPAGKADSGEWSLMLNFKTPQELAFWHQSPERAALIADALHFVESGFLGQDTAGEENGWHPQTMITEVILSKIKSGQDSAYRAWTVRMQMAQAKYPGYRGMHLQPPIASEGGHWTTLLAFDTMERLQDWKKSPDRKELLEEARAFIESEELMPLTTSFPGWMPINPRTGKAPSPWKTALLVLLGLYPTVVLEIYFVYPLLSFLNPSVATFIGNIGSVAVTSFITMPLFVGWFGAWLFPDNDAAKSRQWIGTCLICLLFLLEITLLWKILY